MKIKHFLPLLLLLGSNEMLTAQEIALTPQPAHLTVKDGRFEFGNQLKAKVTPYQGDSIRMVFESFKKELQEATGIKVSSTQKEAKARIILDLNPQLPAEAYKLNVSKKQVRIEASRPAGFYYALQTLKQLMPRNVMAGVATSDHSQWSLPSVEIEDAPRFEWRGFMLDEGRHFFGKDEIKRVIDMMAIYKMNRFHWHLTEGLGWRIEIKQYPHLTRTGGSVGKGEEQQGFYTQEEIRDIIEYARQRNITIVPEIDMPGHAEAALSAYPELGCFGLPVEIPQSGFTQNIFCAGKDGTLRFLKNVLDEVCALFPSPYIHLGGDEAPKGNWDKCPDCQKRIAAMNLKDSHDLQLWFSAQMADYLKSKGRKAIFWGDVVYHDGYPLPDNIVIQWWNYRGHKELALQNAIKHHYPVICSSNYYTYLNFPVTPWRGYTNTRTFDLKDIYQNNPSDKAINQKDPLILGMTCALWTDDGVTERMIDRRLFPRILALAEQMWYQGERLDFTRFHQNILQRKEWFEQMGFEFGPALKSEVKKGYQWD